MHIFHSKNREKCYKTKYRNIRLNRHPSGAPERAELSNLTTYELSEVNTITMMLEGDFLVTSYIRVTS